MDTGIFKSNLTLLFLLCFCAALYSQRDVVSAGGDASGSGGSAAYSIGQPSYTHFGGEDGLISLGVQQPYVVIMVQTDEPSLGISASVMPNPALNSVHLFVDHEAWNGSVQGQLFYGLYDMNGKIIRQEEIISNRTVVGMEDLPSEIYVLRITLDNKEVKTIKIFKTN